MRPEIFCHTELRDDGWYGIAVLENTPIPGTVSVIGPFVTEGATLDELRRLYAGFPMPNPDSV